MCVDFLVNIFFLLNWWYIKTFTCRIYSFSSFLPLKKFLECKLDGPWNLWLLHIWQFKGCVLFLASASCKISYCTARFFFGIFSCKPCSRLKVLSCTIFCFVQCFVCRKDSGGTTYLYYNLFYYQYLSLFFHEKGISAI